MNHLFELFAFHPGMISIALLTNTDATLAVVGHSLGGALSELAIADLHVEGILKDRKVISFTYGACRVGNYEFAR